MTELSFRERILQADDSIVLNAYDDSESYTTTSMFRQVWGRLRRSKLSMVALTVIILLLLVAICAPLIAPEGYDYQDLRNGLAAPSLEHPLGTDNLGRDLLARIVWGGRWSLTVGIVSMVISVSVGILLGLICGFFGGRIDNVIMRVLDVFMSIPSVLLAIAISAALGAGLFNLMLACSVGTIPGFARIMRASVMSVRDLEFTEAAKCSGASNARIMFKYIFPNCLSPLIVQITMGLGGAILVASSMSFLGLGLEPPTPEWGAMLSAGKTYIRTAWWYCVFPGVAIMLSVLAFNILGDGLRDALDPKLKR